MPPTTIRRRVRFKQRVPRSTRGHGRRTQRVLVAALLAVGFGAPLTLFLRAAARGGLSEPARIVHRLRVGTPANAPLLSLPAAAPEAIIAAPANETATRPAVGWSTPAPDAPVARSWEAPFAGGRSVAVAPVVPAAPPVVVRTALNNARDAGFVPAPAPGAPVRGAFTLAPADARGLRTPALASLVASAGTTTSAGVESRPAGPPTTVTGAALRPDSHPRVATAVAVVPTNPFIWSGAAAAGSTPNPNWTVGNNWLGNLAPTANPTPGFAADIIYAPTSLATATNVNLDYTISSLTFQGPVAGGTPSVDTPSFTVTGRGSQGGTSDLSIGAGGITNASANAQTLALPVYAVADQTFSVTTAAGRLNLPGPTPDPSQPGVTPIALYLQGSGRTLTVDGPGTTNVSGVVSEGGPAAAAQIIKNGTGTLILAGNNLYTGGTTLNAGTVDVRNDNALGTGTFTVNGGTITNNAVAGSTPFPVAVTLPNAVTLNGNLDRGASNADLTFAGNVALGAATRTISASDIPTDPGVNSNRFTFSGVISGGAGAGLTFTNSPRDLFVLSGTAANTYTGTTTADGVFLNLAKANGVAVPGDLVVRNGGSVSSVGGQLAPTTNLTVNAGSFSATGDFSNSADETIASLNGTTSVNSTVSIGSFFRSSTLTVGQGSYAGTLQDGILFASRGAPAAAPAANAFGGGGVLVKNTSGILTLTGTNTYSGGTTVAAGALFANNDPALADPTVSGTGSGDVLVLNGARLGGSGSVGAVGISGEGSVPPSTTTVGVSLLSPLRGPAAANAITTVVNPGILGAGATLNATAILTVNGNLTLTSNALLETELGGTTAGTGYDQIRVAGTVTLGGDLSLALINGFTLTVGDTFYILDGTSDPNLGPSTRTGLFANVTPETNTTGLFTDAAGNLFRVNYVASDPLDPSGTSENDVSVTVLAVPEPGSLALAAAGVSAALGIVARRRRRQIGV